MTFSHPLARGLAAALPLAGLYAAPALAETPPTAEDAPMGFAGDYSWMNGNNYQPASLLSMGPLTWSLMVDSYYGYAFNTPVDHTIFPGTTAPRHNEFNLNLATLGLEVTGQKHVFGKLLLQGGNYVDNITGTDGTVGRGAYTNMASLRYIQQAYGGYHFNVLNGLNFMAGIFPAYLGLDSYIPQENWGYSHNVLSDWTPYYLSGAMFQLYPRPDLKTELWLVNGWQSLSKYGEGMGLGYSVNWRPTDRLSLLHNGLFGNFEADQTRTRYFLDSSVQWKYAVAPTPWIQHMALAAVADVGYNTASTTAGGAAATPLGGAGLQHRVVFDDRWALALRGSAFYDPQKLVSFALPGGQAIAGDLTAGEATATLDFKPSPWVLYRLEYRHDFSSVPYIAGPGGITAPAGSTAPFTPDLRTSGDRLIANATVRF